VRGIILIGGRLLLVNAWPDNRSDLWCAPGGGVHAGTPLPDNLVREVHEETGLTVAPGALALVNEFHDPASGFHQVDLYYRCTLIAGDPAAPWTDPEGVVTERRLFAPGDFAVIRFKPDSLPRVAFDPSAPVHYDPLEEIVA
jgi:8-oxo-dGTP pyrophosphatase MutT (NUDIX family)